MAITRSCNSAAPAGPQVCDCSNGNSKVRAIALVNAIQASAVHMQKCSNRRETGKRGSTPAWGPPGGHNFFFFFFFFNFFFTARVFGEKCYNSVGGWEMNCVREYWDSD